MSKHKKLIIFIASGVLLAIAAAALVFFVLIPNNDNGQNPSGDQSAKLETAKNTKDEAFEAMQQKDDETAIELFEKALDMYEETNTTGIKTPEQVDIEAQLYLLKKSDDLKASVNE